ncbi:MAG: hypothetical protein HC906_01350 [Bacteroidales bacterium]|nr:hypothetical protein [Bacteroidales bacterium]
MKALLLNMVKEDYRYRLNGILATVILHMVMVIFFLIYKLGEVKNKHEETLKIEIMEDETLIEELIAPVEPELEQLSNLLPQEAAKNIAVNVAEKMNDEISTEKYINDLKQELGIKELNQQLDRNLPDEPGLVENTPDNKKDEGKKPQQFKGRTNITFNLAGRWIRKQYVPVYRCEGGGTVVVDIVVDEYGNVMNASMSGKSATKNECLIEEAINSALQFIFNADQKAGSRQKGTITFQFISQ